MTERLPKHLLSRCPYFLSKCDICGKQRSLKVHAKCSKIRQERHQQELRNEAFDNLLASGGMFSGKTFDQVWLDDLKGE